MDSKEKKENINSFLFWFFYRKLGCSYIYTYFKTSIYLYRTNRNGLL